MRRRDLMWLAGLAAPGPVPVLAGARGRRASCGSASRSTARWCCSRSAACSSSGWRRRAGRSPGPSSRAGRSCSRRSTSAPSTSAPPARRRRSSPRPPGRRCSMSATSRPHRRARRSWCRRTRRSPTSPASRAGRSRSTRARTSTTCWCGRWRRPALAYGDIEPVYLPPADARAAFERGAVDAWVIWDPFLAAAQAATGARTLADGTGLVSNHQFYLAAQPFAADRAGDRPGDPRRHRRDRPLGARPTPARSRPCSRRAWASRRRCSRWRWAGWATACGRSTTAVVAEQQRIADTFHGLGLLPKPITVRDAVWKATRMSRRRRHRRPLVPADPRRRPLSRHQPRRPPGRPRLPAPDRPGGRRSRLLRRAAADRALLRGQLGRRLGAGAR